MQITPAQHQIVSRFFPGYNSAKSAIVAEFGNFYGGTPDGEFIVKVFRRGTWRFAVANGTAKNARRITA